MSSQPTLTVVPAHAVATAPPSTAASLPVDPAARTGCTWWVVAPAATAHHPHAA